MAGTGVLPFIRGIDLTMNNLEDEKFPEAVEDMKSLRWLRLTDTQLKNIPQEINSLSKLEHLTLKRNQVDRIETGELSVVKVPSNLELEPKQPRDDGRSGRHLRQRRAEHVGPLAQQTDRSSRRDFQSQVHFGAQPLAQPPGDDSQSTADEHDRLAALRRQPQRVGRASSATQAPDQPPDVDPVQQPAVSLPNPSSAGVDRAQDAAHAQHTENPRQHSDQLRDSGPSVGRRSVGKPIDKDPRRTAQSTQSEALEFGLQSDRRSVPRHRDLEQTRDLDSVSKPNQKSALRVVQIDQNQKTLSERKPVGLRRDSVRHREAGRPRNLLRGRQPAGNDSRRIVSLRRPQKAGLGAEQADHVAGSHTPDGTRRAGPERQPRVDDAAEADGTHERLRRRVLQRRLLAPAPAAAGRRLRAPVPGRADYPEGSGGQEVAVATSPSRGRRSGRRPGQSIERNERHRQGQAAGRRRQVWGRRRRSSGRHQGQKVGRSVGEAAAGLLRVFRPRRGSVARFDHLGD